MAGGECKGNPTGDEKKEEGKATWEEKDPGVEDATMAVTPAPSLELVSVDCGPSDCPVEEGLEMSMEFALDRPLEGAWWEMKFLVDSVNERHLVRLGATGERDYPLGSCSMHFEAPRVSVEGIKPCTLANTGLLIATLVRRRAVTSSNRAEGKEETGVEGKGGGREEVAQVNLVVQVTDVGQGRLERVIYSPLE
ncbi:unnamed protein product [Scytosiphon promiscuus]